MNRIGLRRASMLAMTAIVVACANCPARAQEGERPGGLFDLIFGGSERMTGDRSIQTVEHAAQPNGPDMVIRLDRLESQIRQLTGVIEQLQFRNQQLEAQVRRMQEDQDSRRPQGRSQYTPGMPPAPPTSSPAPPPASYPARRSDAFDPTLNPNAPGAPHTLGSMPGTAQPRPGEMADASAGVPGQPQGQIQGQRGVPLESMSPTGSASLAPTLPPSQTSKDEFDLAYGYVLRRDYALAEDSFRRFLSKYPNDKLAGDAAFWFGEALFQRQHFRDAAETFLNVSTKFEGNPKAPDALLRLGQSLAALGEKEAACASLGEVLRKFPRASVALKQGVEREQKRVRC
jgi:tol-pal system protein YbgF